MGITRSTSSTEKGTDNSKPQESTAIERATFGALATLVLRLLSFICTQWTLRRIDPSTLGRTSISLELMHTTIIFMSREGFRLSLTNNVISRNKSYQSESRDSETWNVAWLTIPTSTVLSLVAFFWHIQWNSISQENADYRMSGLLYCLAAAMEGWVEPAVLHFLRRVEVAPKASAEGIATVGKTVMTVFLLSYLPDTPITAFGLAQVTYSLVYGIILIQASYRSLQGPRFDVRLDRKTCSMTFMFTLQGLFKHCLTEGDRIVLSSLAGSYDQGVYAMGSSYGGLAARMLLQPIEENGRLLLSRQVSDELAKVPKDSSSLKDPCTRDPLAQTFTVLVKLVLYIGLVFSCLAVNYTGVLLRLLAGQKWGSNEQADDVLAAFCVYTAFLAWNGTTEALVYAVSSTGGELARLGLAHTVTGILFAAIATLGVGWYGTVGLVAANCMSMFMRSIYSLYVATQFFHERWYGKKGSSSSNLPVLQPLLRQMLPKPVVWVSFLASFVATRLSRNTTVENADSANWIKLAAKHIAVGATSGIGVLSVAFLAEHEFRQSIRGLFRKRANIRRD